MLGFLVKFIYFLLDGQMGNIYLVSIGLVTSVISIYYYISVIKMMVVTEPKEASKVVKAYPSIEWSIPGMSSLKVALIFVFS